MNSMNAFLILVAESIRNSCCNTFSLGLKFLSNTSNNFHEKKKLIKRT